MLVENTLEIHIFREQGSILNFEGSLYNLYYFPKHSIISYFFCVLKRYDFCDPYTKI